MNGLHLARAALLILACVALAACPSLATRTAPPSVDRAQSFAAAGEHAQAARIYGQLADETAGTDRAQFLLLAAGAWLDANRPTEAERALAALPANMSSQQASYQQLLQSAALLARNKPDEAWQQLESLPVPAQGLPAVRYWQQRQRIALGTNRPVAAAEAQIALERLLTAADRSKSRNEFLTLLRDARARGVSLDAPAQADPLVRGWLAAGMAAADNARDPALGATRIAAFRARFPSHPALEPLAGEATIGEPLAGGLTSASHVALLLPITGPAAGAAVRIREGFLAAYYQLPETERPLIRVYDTNGVTAADLISQARAAGATFMVGPLTREAVAATAEFPAERPPTLALKIGRAHV